MVSKYWENRRKNEEKEKQIVPNNITMIITNKDTDKISVKSEYDKQFNIYRIEVKLKGGYKK